MNDNKDKWHVDLHQIVKKTFIEKKEIMINLKYNPQGEKNKWK